MLYRTSIGLDVHARSIAATAFIPETGEIVQKAFPYDAGKVAEWAKGMPQPAGCACGSGPTGSGLKRKPGKAGVPCVVGAVSKMLRKGIVYPGKTAWAKAHREWLGRPGFADPCERLVFGEYLESVRSLGLRRARPGRAIEERAAGEDMAPAVSALRCVRGIPAVTAFSIAAVRRIRHATKARGFRRTI